MSTDRRATTSEPLDQFASFESQSLLARREIETAALVRAHPPRLSNRNKQLVLGLASPPNAQHAGSLTVSRWRGVRPPESLSPIRTEFTLREGAFDYESPAIDRSSARVSWYLNFADLNLFAAYGSGLFAQDEMQVAEHPALASLREYLVDEKDAQLAPLTVERGQPTPILVRGVERRCHIATDRDVELERPYGLYGNQFARAKESAIVAATTVLRPPTISNLIAIEAPPGGSGAYSRAVIDYIAMTAYTGFRAACLESQIAIGAPARMVVHTGGWGTGAYGGNKLIMVLLQLIAARAAGVSSLVYHAFEASSVGAFRDGVECLARELEPLGNVETMLGAVADMRLLWGQSDGN